MAISSAIRTLLRSIPSWAGNPRYKGRIPDVNDPYLGKGQRGFGTPEAPLDASEMLQSQHRAEFGIADRERDEILSELFLKFDPSQKTAGRGRRLPVTDEIPGTQDPLRNPSNILHGPLEISEAQLAKFGPQTLRSLQANYLLRGKPSIHEVRRHAANLGLYKRGQQRPPTSMFSALPAAGKYLPDDPEFFAATAKAAHYWMKNDALPGAMREINRGLLDTGRTEAQMMKGIERIYGRASRMERDAAAFDMARALEREFVSTTAMKRLASNESAVKTIQGTYIQANRIRAIQEMLEQFGHGSQRGLHDMSGMLYKRSQRLGQAVERGTGKGIYAFDRELTEWKDLEKFLQRFGTQAFYHVTRVAQAKRLSGEMPPYGGPDPRVDVSFGRNR